MNKTATRQEMDGPGIFLMPGEKERELTELAALSDSVSRSDAEAQEQPAKPKKNSTTVRIDADVLAWLREPGKGYQSRINAILRREMLDFAAVRPRIPELGE